MKRIKNKELRCVITGKLLNNREAVLTSQADVYVEKQGYKVLKNEQITN